MLITVRIDDGAGNVVEGARKGPRLGHLGLAALVTNQMAINILPGNGLGEAQMAR